MAKIVLGIGSSHSPMLSTPPEQWGQRVDADRQNPALAFRGDTYDFDGLVALRAGEGFHDQVNPEMWRRRHDACQRGIRLLADKFAAAAPAPSHLRSIPTDHLGARRETERLEVLPDRVHGTGGTVDENRRFRPPGKGFDGERTRPGEQIEDATASNIAEPPEQRLANPIGRRTHAFGRTAEPTAAQLTTDDAHGAPLIAQCGVSRHSVKSRPAERSWCRPPGQTGTL